MRILTVSAWASSARSVLILSGLESDSTSNLEVVLLGEGSEQLNNLVSIWHMPILGKVLESCIQGSIKMLVKPTQIILKQDGRGGIKDPLSVL